MACSTSPRSSTLLIETQPSTPNLPPGPPQGPQDEFWKVLWSDFKDWFDDFIDLREGMDREAAIKSIKTGKLMRGSNAWMLICSIMIASLGLNLNSGAVIIGAMLISPLMSPILGVGLGVGTNDRDMLRLSMLHFSIAIFIALFTSTLYFFFTPIDNFTEEMAARTAPNLLDGMVAIFGGLAGIISVTRADQSNAIPGVAIATALMPPLCVSGYGIATGDWNIAARSFYLFFLNSFFIATTAYIIIRLLRFPYRRYLNRKQTRRSRLLIGFFSILIIIPGFFILREVLAKTRIDRGVQQFVDTYFATNCAEYNLLPISDDTTHLVMQLTTNNFSQDSVAVYDSILQSPPFNVSNTYILPLLNPFGNIERLDRLESFQATNLDQVRNEVSNLQAAWEKQQSELETLNEEMNRFRVDSSELIAISAKARLAFPRLESITIGQVQRSDLDELAVELDHLPLLVIRRKAGGRTRERAEELTRIESYFKLELEVDTLLLVENN